MTPDQLSRYWRRIGYARAPDVSIETLNDLTYAHSTHIPFENIDVLLGRPVDLSLSALFDKLVTRRRGGYCFEQNGLLLAVLDTLGFNARPLRASVRLGQADRSLPTAHTHMCLAVVVADQTWVTDVGVGAQTLTQALKLEADTVQTTPHDQRRFQWFDEKWFLQVKQGDDWVDVYEFAGDTMTYPDRRVANWYTSTHPDSHFRHQLSVAVAQPEGTRFTLSDNVFTQRWRNGESHKRTLSSPTDLQGVLADRFGLDIPVSAIRELPVWG